ncbi:hypothetical protein BD310DRAFT_832095 [Dichomitus squalens]|uniref:Uncharacterized protein n=1 Tax=Dichomitus squalens TaxID=114155 RepID=A0A4Q9PGV0_9APHY|nr:hypothetical protein BD310DRAFT_832095 [Dichomitus squalens]
MLYPHQLGYPVWNPDTSTGEVFVGDVGWMEKGGFNSLFNILSSEDDPIHFERGVPPEFEPSTLIQVTSPDRAVATHAVDSAPVRFTAQFNEDLRSLGSWFEMRASQPAIHFKYKPREGPGAFLIFDVDAMNEKTLQKRHVISYMSKHFHEWVGFANTVAGRTRTFKEEDMMLISGTTKVRQWALGVWTPDMCGEPAEGVPDLHGQFDTTSTSDSIVMINGNILPSTHYHQGPKLRVIDSDSPESRYRSQSVFLNYYRIRPRRLEQSVPQFLRAAAGPHDLPPGGKDPEVGTSQHTYDPVAHLVDYILDHTNAGVAIACDADIMPILPDSGLPDNIPEFLNLIAPPVQVDQDGVGTIAWDAALNSSSDAILSARARLQKYVSLRHSQSHDDTPMGSIRVAPDTSEGRCQRGTGTHPAQPPLSHDHLHLNHAFYSNIVAGITMIKCGPWSPILSGYVNALRIIKFTLRAWFDLRSREGKRAQEVASKEEDKLTQDGEQICAFHRSLGGSGGIKTVLDQAPEVNAT